MPTVRRLRHPAAAAFAAALALSTAAAAPAAAVTLPVGEAHGVRLEGVRSGVVVDFTQRAAPLYKRIAGKRVEVECGTVDRGDQLGGGETGSRSTQVRAAKARKPLRTRLVAVRYEYCSIWLVPRRDSGSRTLIVSVPLTQAGAVELDEQERVSAMNFVLTVAGEAADRRSPSAWPAPAALVETLVRSSFPRRAIVALDSAAASPPAGAVGYWSDGARSVAVVALSATGRRLFIEFGPDDVLRTNVAGFLFVD